MFDPNNFVAPAPGGGFVVYVDGREIGTFPSQTAAEQAYNQAKGLPNEPDPGFEWINPAIESIKAQIAQQAAYQAYLNKKLEMIDAPMAELEKERQAEQAAREAARQAQEWVRTQLQAGTEYGRQIIDLATSMARERQNLSAQLLDLLRTQGQLGLQGGQALTQAELQRARGIADLFEREAQLGLQGAQAATQEALGVAQLLASLRGPRNAFQQQAVMHGLNELGVSRALDALAGKYTLPSFQAPQATPQAATLQTLVEDLRASGTPGQSVIDRFLQNLPGLMEAGRGAFGPGTTAPLREVLGGLPGLMDEGRAAIYGYRSPLEGLNLPLGQVFAGVMEGIPGPMLNYARYAMEKIGGPRVPQDWYDRMVGWYDQFRQSKGRRPTADEWVQAFSSFTGLPTSIGRQMYQMGMAYVQQTGQRADPELQNRWLQGILTGASLIPGPALPGVSGGSSQMVQPWNPPGGAAFQMQPVWQAPPSEDRPWSIQPVGHDPYAASLLRRELMRQQQQRVQPAGVPQSFGDLMQALGRPQMPQKPASPPLPRTAAPGQVVALGGGGQAPPTGVYLQNLPAPHRIVGREFLKMPKDTQEFFLSAYEAAGWSPNDVLEMIQRTMPQFRAPTVGMVR